MTGENLRTGQIRPARNVGRGFLHFLHLLHRLVPMLIGGLCLPDAYPWHIGAAYLLS